MLPSAMFPVPVVIEFKESFPMALFLLLSEYNLAPLEKLASVVLLIVEILDALVAISVSLEAMLVEFVEMLDVLVEILEVFVLISDSTSVIVPTARVPSTVTSELKLVALVTVPPVNVLLPSRATPSHSRVPSLFVRAVPSIYKLSR